MDLKKITPAKFLQISEQYSLDQIYLLSLINQGSDISSLSNKSIKINAIVQTLVRKGLIHDNRIEITKAGKELLVEIDKNKKRLKLDSLSTNDEFETWWKLYPSTDEFSYKGRTFPESRRIKTARDQCLLKFTDIILKEDVTAEELIKCLDYELTLKKEQSLQSGQNKMTYMQNPLTYLNQKTFQTYIGKIRSGLVVQKSNTRKSSTTDI